MNLSVGFTDRPINPLAEYYLGSIVLFFYVATKLNKSFDNENDLIGYFNSANAKTA